MSEEERMGFVLVFEETAEQARSLRTRQTQAFNFAFLMLGALLALTKFASVSDYILKLLPFVAILAGGSALYIIRSYKREILAKAQRLATLHEQFPEGIRTLYEHPIDLPVTRSLFGDAVSNFQYFWIVIGTLGGFLILIG